jgi:hypothetical protein
VTTRGDRLFEIAQMIRLIETDRAAGLPNVAADRQAVLDAQVADGRVTRRDLRMAWRIAQRDLGMLLERNRRDPWHRREYPSRDV